MRSSILILFALITAACNSDVDEQWFLDQWDKVSDTVHGIAHELGGSISAEHGLGRMKREEITHYKSAVEIDLMRTLKAALDPKRIMNPGKVV